MKPDLQKDTATFFRQKLLNAIMPTKTADSGKTVMVVPADKNTTFLLGFINYRCNLIGENLKILLGENHLALLRTLMIL